MKKILVTLGLLFCLSLGGLPASAATDGNVAVVPDMTCYLDAGDGADDVYIGGGKYGVTDKAYWLCERLPDDLYVWAQMRFSTSPYGPWTFVGARVSTREERTGGVLQPWVFGCVKGYYQTYIEGSFWYHGNFAHGAAGSKVLYINCSD